MSFGVKVHISLFNPITEALTAKGIDNSLWDPAVMFIENYNGDVEIECYNESQREQFYEIVEQVKAEHKTSLSSKKNNT